jgi:hypothetical protein
LGNLENDDISAKSVVPKKSPNSVTNPFVVRLTKSRKADNKKIVIIGDSHSRKCGSELKHCLGSSYSISGFVQPGAEMKDILSSMQSEIKNLQWQDTLVIWGGSQDISRNNAKEALTHLHNFVKNNQQMNIIVITAPYRHDLIPSSCVNHEVRIFNRKLVKKMAPFNNVKILAANLERRFFTTHGMHMNAAGKERAAQRLAVVVKSFSTIKRGITSPEKIPNLLPASQTGDTIKRSTVEIVEVKNSNDDGDILEQTRNLNSNPSVPGVLCGPDLFALSQEINSDPKMPEVNVVPHENTYIPMMPQCNEVDANTRSTIRVFEVLNTSETTSDQRCNEDKNQVNPGVREKNDTTGNHSDNIQVQDDSSRQQEKEAVMIANRRSRKTPVTRSEDFLWATTSKIQAR